MIQRERQPTLSRDQQERALPTEERRPETKPAPSSDIDRKRLLNFSEAVGAGRARSCWSRLGSLSPTS